MNHGPIPHIPVQVHSAFISYGIPRQEPSLHRVVVAVGEEEETGLIVRIIPPLSVVTEGIVWIGDQRIPPGVVGGCGKDVLIDIQPLNHAPLRIESVVDAWGAGASGKQPIRAPHVEHSHESDILHIVKSETLDISILYSAFHCFVNPCQFL